MVNRIDDEDDRDELMELLRSQLAEIAERLERIKATNARFGNLLVLAMTGIPITPESMPAAAGLVRSLSAWGEANPTVKARLAETDAVAWLARFNAAAESN